MTSFQVEKGVTGERIDTRWRASAHGESSARSGHVVPSDFAAVAVAHGSDFVIPSGVALKREASGKYVPVTATSDVLAGYLNDNQGIVYNASNASAPHGVSVLVHGIIKASVLPVGAQRAIVKDAATVTTGLFTYVED